MGGSSKQVIGYKYFTNFLLFVGNPIEKILGINFDNRGWLNPLTTDTTSALDRGEINEPYLYGETEGGVAGNVYARYGTNHQTVVPFYKEYMEINKLRASAYPFQSYLAFEDFYVGNINNMKDMMLWPKRTRIRNDGRRQWYEIRGDGATVCEVGEKVESSNYRLEDMAGMQFYYSGPKKSNMSLISEVEYYLSVNTTATGVGGQWASFSDSNVGNQEITHTTAAAKVGIATQNKGLITLDGEGSFSSKSDLSIVSYGDAKAISLLQEITKEEEAIDGLVFREFTWSATFDSAGDGLEFGVIFSVSGVQVSEITQHKKINISAYMNVRKAQEYAFKNPYSGDGIDINPVHKIREILTDDTAMNKPEASVNDVNFMKAADRIYHESLGISAVFTEKNCLEAISEICYHIEAGIRVNRQTGLYEIVLFRDDWFAESEIHTIPESKIKKDSMQYEIANVDDAINQVNVNFYDRENIKDSSFSISDNGLIQTLGQVNAETIDFPYFMNMRNAEIVAGWKLKQLSTGVFRGSFTTGWREARKWNRYDLLRLPWSKRWNGTILVRIMSINLGNQTDNKVTIEYIEVVPATTETRTTIVTDYLIDTGPRAPEQCNAKVFELPYFEAVQALGEREVNTELADNPEVGYLCAIAEKQQSNSLNAALHVGSGDSFEKVATVNYCETVYLDQSIGRMSATFIVKNVGNIASVRTGSQIFINNEIMVYKSYNAETKALTVKRGAFSIPQNHEVDSILYFADDFVAVDQTLYVEGEIIGAKVLTTTPSGMLDPYTDFVDLHQVEFKARAIRPYPPANVKINDSYWPETHIIANDIVLTWAHRNRTQQTGGTIIGWYEGDVSVEDGVTYSYELTSGATVLASGSGITSNATTINANVLLPNKAHKLKLWSVRNGHESYEKFEHSFFVEAASLILTATATKSNVSGNTVPQANIGVNVDESLKANMKFDGSSIVGKAPAGATITIEVDE